MLSTRILNDPTPAPHSVCRRSLTALRMALALITLNPARLLRNQRIHLIRLHLLRAHLDASIVRRVAQVRTHHVGIDIRLRAVAEAVALRAGPDSARTRGASDAHAAAQRGDEDGVSG